MLTIFRAFLGKLLDNQKEVSAKLALIDQAFKLIFKTFCPPDDLVMFKRVIKAVLALGNGVNLNTDSEVS